MGYLGARGKSAHEKIWTSKSRVRLPLNILKNNYYRRSLREHTPLSTPIGETTKESWPKKIPNHYLALWVCGCVCDSLRKLKGEEDIGGGGGRG